MSENTSYRIKLKLSNDVVIEGECFAGPSTTFLRNDSRATSTCTITEPPCIVLEAKEYWPYDGLWDEDSGAWKG